MSFTIQLRRDLAANWTADNPVLAQGEAGYELDTRQLKIGDGSTAWNSLAYFAPAETLPVLQKVAATAMSGYTKINGTGTVLSWTAPNDGNVHRVMVMYNSHVTTAETGGQMLITAFAPDNTSHTYSIDAGGQTAGLHQATGSTLVYPGTAVTLSQSSALTAGATVIWSEFWAL